MTMPPASRCHLGTENRPPGSGIRGRGFSQEGPRGLTTIPPCREPKGRTAHPPAHGVCICNGGRIVQPTALPPPPPSPRGEPETEVAQTESLAGGPGAVGWGRLLQQGSTGEALEVFQDGLAPRGLPTAPARGGGGREGAGRPGATLSASPQGGESWCDRGSGGVCWGLRAPLRPSDRPACPPPSAGFPPFLSSFLRPTAGMVVADGVPMTPRSWAFGEGTECLPARTQANREETARTPPLPTPVFDGRHSGALHLFEALVRHEYEYP